MAAKGGKEMEIAIKIAGKVQSSFKSALNAATKGVGRLGSKIADVSGKGLKAIPKGIGTVAKTVGAATAAAASAVGAMGVAAVRTGMDFEKSMSQVAATMLLDKSTEEGQKAFATLENAARQCGRETAFSATEAAEALNYLALAGYDAEKAAGALPTVLKLAGAGAMELAAASDMITDSMSALDIEATQENLESFADQMAQTASKSNTSVAQLGEAILTVGGTAKNLAGGTTELNTALGILADNGIKAAEGGTHLRNMILSLQSPRNAAAAAMFEDMGLSAYDAAGNMRSLGDIFGDINKSLSGASTQKVDETLSTIFKLTDLSSARAMLAATTDSVKSLGAVVDASLAGSGTSISKLGIDLKKMAKEFDAATSQKKFAQDMKKQFNMTGEQAGVLFNGLQSLASGTGNRFDELTKAVEGSAGACADMYAIQLDNLNGDIDILKSGLSDLGISIYKDLNAPLREMTQFATRMVSQLSFAFYEQGMEGMAGAAGNCLSAAVNALIGYAPKVTSLGISLLENFIDGITGNSGEIAGAASRVLSVFTEGLFKLVPKVITAGLDLILQFTQSITGELPQLMDSGTQAVTNLVLGIVQMLPAVIQMGIQLILSLAQGILSNLPLILQMGTQAILNLVSGITQSIPMLIQGGFQLITSLVQGIAQNLPAIAQAAFTIILSLIGGLITAIPQLWAAAKSLPGAIWDAIISVDWLEVGWDLIKSIGQGIIDGALSIGDSIINTVKGWFGGGDDEAASSGASAAQSYAAGMGSKGFAKSAVAAGFESGAFDGLNTAGAEMAGTQAGEAFSTGLNSSMASSSLDTAGFNANMASAGNAGAEALSNGFNTGLAGISVDAASLVDTSSMAEAGNAGVSAVIDGMNNSLAGASVGIGAAAVDTSGINAAFMDAGVSGADAISTGMTGNSQSVIQAASSLGMEVNTSMDESWKKMEQGTQTAMQKLTSTVTNAARSAANAVKLAFENMSITIPKPKLPVISVDYKTKSYGNGGNIKVPGFNVAWNAAGGIFNRPTIFNTPAGMQGVGEAGPEAVLPLDMLWAKMKEILNDAVTINDGSSVINSLLEKLKGTGNNNSRNTPELAGAGGVNIQYSPVYNLYGSATKQDAIEAGRISMAEFKKLMKQHEKDLKRKKL